MSDATSYARRVAYARPGGRRNLYQGGMELAILHPSFGAVGGAEVLAAAEAHALRADGVDARIVTASVDAARWRDALDGIPVARYRQRTIGDAVAWTTVARLRMQARRARALLGGADVVIAHNHPCNALLGAMRLDAVRLWQVNEPSRALHLVETSPMLAARARALGAAAPEWVTRQFATRLASWERRVARGGDVGARRRFDMTMTARLDGLYAISEYSRAMARRIYGRCDATIVYPSVREPAGAMPVRRGIRHAGIQVLVQSRLEPVKNVETVLRGFASFAHGRTGSHLHVVGEGSDGERLRALAAEVAPGAVTFHGFVDTATLETVTAACDVFALLPVDEPFGMVFTEAMVRGLLCIGPDHGGPSEILDGGALGWTVDAFAPEALAATLEAIATMNNGEADRRRAAAIASVQGRFSDAAMMVSLRRVLREHGVEAC